MANQDMIKSGFDMEILLGRGFFGEILLAYKDAGIFPNSIELFDGVTLRLDALNLVFHQNLKIGVNFALSLLVNENEYSSGDTDIFFNFEFIPIRNATGNVSRVDIYITFHSFNSDKLDNFLSRVDNEPILMGNNTYTSTRIKRAIRNKLRELLEFNYKTNLVTNQVEDVQVRTLSNPAAIGIYINFIMRRDPQPGNIYPPRGDITKAQNPLSMETNIGIFVPGSVYPMLSTEIKSTMAVVTNGGVVSYPIYDSRYIHLKVIGKLTSFSISSAELIAESGYFGVNDPEQLLISINTRVHVRSIDADADAWMTLRPIIENGKLKWEKTNFRTHFDIDWEDQLRIALMTGVFISIFTGFAALPFLTAILYAAQSIIEEAVEDYAEDLANGIISDEMDNLMDSIPEAITIGKKRLDPFYETHYQVAANFEEAKVNTAGMAFMADTGHKEIYPIIGDVLPIKAIRNSDNVLIGVVYKIPNSDQILNPEEFYILDPNKPDEFYLGVGQMQGRLKDSKLRKRIYLRPTHVNKSGSRIKYIKFDSGIYLTPNEAGELYQIAAIRISGNFRRIRMSKTGTYYFRGRRDRSKNNNLSELPTFKIK